MRDGGLGEGRDKTSPEAAGAESALLAAACPERAAERRVPGEAVRGSHRLPPEVRRKSLRLFRRGQDAGTYPPTNFVRYDILLIFVSALCLRAVLALSVIIGRKHDAILKKPR